MTTIGRLSVLLVVAMGASACCDDNVKVIVLPGHVDLRACMEAARTGKSSPFTVVCGGKEVTVCWESNLPKVKIDPIGMSNGTSFGSSFVGIEYFKPPSSVTVRATASSCAVA